MRALREAAATNFTCTVEAMAPDFMPAMTQFYGREGVRAEYAIDGEGEVFFRIVQAVENPNMVGFEMRNGGDGDHGDGDRILAGTA